VHLLNKGCEKISRYNLATCAIRVIQVMSTSEVCVLAMVKVNVVPVIVKSLRPPQRDAAFTLETLKIMLKTGRRLPKGEVGGGGGGAVGVRLLSCMCGNGLLNACLCCQTRAPCMLPWTRHCARTRLTSWCPFWRPRI
jgi:hypothetical protein